MADEQDYEVAREALANDFMSIASSTPDGNPWVVAVRNRGFLDGRLRWSSQPDRYHSELIKDNAQVAFLLYAPSPRVDDEATLALYGRAVVDSIEQDAIEGETYFATVTEAWSLISEKVDGQWRQKVQVDPSKIGDVRKAK